MDFEKLAVVIPIYNEEVVVGRVLEAWYQQLSRLKADFTIFAYNDGSGDQTRARILEAAAKHPERIVLKDKRNSGHGPTVLQGYREAAAAGFDWIFQVDSDDEMTPDEFPELWAQREHYDFLAGMRSGRRQPLARKIISQVSRWSVRVLYGKTIVDVNVPYRLMRVAALKSVWERIPADTFAPNVIIAGMIAEKKLRYFEMPVSQHERRTGEVSIKKWKLLRAAVLSFFQTFGFALENRRGPLIFLLVALFSLLAKLLLATRGYNYDYESYRIVAELVGEGKNVYAETFRYNYGPIWFYVLYFLKMISGSLFRYSLPLFLGIIDICIAGILWRLRYRAAALIFLLSPLGMHISGFHNQFDNFAILMALFSVWFLMKHEKKLTIGQAWIAAILLGISLTIKHIFLFFPIWLFFRNYSRKVRLVLLLVPFFIFIGSFLPYALTGNTPETLAESFSFAEKQIETFVNNEFWLEEEQKKEIEEYLSRPHMKAMNGIFRNVFQYKSCNNQIFYTYFLPKLFHSFSATFIFLGGMIGCGWFFRRFALFHSFLFYTAVLVILAPATTNQYLAIPLIFSSVFFIPYGIFYQYIPGIYFLFYPRDSNCRDIYISAVFILLVLLFHSGRRCEVLEHFDKQR